MNIAAGDEPVDRGPRPHRCLRIRWGRARGRRRDCRGVPALLAAPGQPLRDRGAARVPGIDRRLAPEGFEGRSDIVVGDRVQGQAGAGESVCVAAVELVDGEGIVSARRLEPLSGDGSFIALYEIEADDLEAVRASMGARARSGRMSKPVAVQSDPPPTVRLLREMSVHTR